MSSIICSNKDGISQSNEGRVYFNNSSVVLGLGSCIQDPILVLQFLNLLTYPNQNQHPLPLNNTLALAAWKVLDDSILQFYQVKLLN